MIETDKMIKQRDNLLWRKTNALLRLAIYKGAANWAGKYYVLNEYPKSGGTWATQLVTSMLDIPNPRHRLPILGTSMIHGHHLSKPNVKNVIILWRDGRDVATSWFYHYVVGNNLTPDSAVLLTREAAGIEDVENIEDAFSRAMRNFLYQPRYPRYTWAQFVDRWAGHQSALHVKYEDLKTDTASELVRVADYFGKPGFTRAHAEKIANEFSFSKQAGRKAGEEAVGKFLRKGIVGDWRNHFDQETRILFNEKAGKQLIKMGYEKDSSWIDD